MPKNNRSQPGKAPTARLPSDVKRSVRSDDTLTVRLPADLKRRLIEAAGDRTLGEEVRRRLETSIGGRPLVGDPKTRRLFDTIEKMINALGGEAEWHKNPTTFDAFRRALDLVLPALRPPGEYDTLQHPYLIAATVGAALSTLLTGPVSEDFFRELSRRMETEVGGEP